MRTLGTNICMRDIQQHGTCVTSSRLRAERRRAIRQTTDASRSTAKEIEQGPSSRARAESTNCRCNTPKDSQQLKETMYRNGVRKGNWDRYAEKRTRLRDAEIWMTGRWDDVSRKTNSKQITRNVRLGPKVKDLEKRWPCC